MKEFIKVFLNSTNLFVWFLKKCCIFFVLKSFPFYIYIFFFVLLVFRFRIPAISVIIQFALKV